MQQPTTRRRFLRETAMLAAAAAAVRGAGGAADGESAAMPTITLGKLTVSRLILGSNPFFGFSHGNPQASGKVMRAYYTPERVMAVMDAAAERGITAVWTPCYDRWIRLWDAYRKKGGKLKVWIGQPDNYKHMIDHINACAAHGGRAVCIQGVCIDRALSQGKVDLVRSWLERIKELGLPAGMATHKPTTHLLAEEKSLPADFYHQCLYQPENYSDACRRKALATVAKLDKPVVAYKVLAAGRLAPRQAYAHVLKRLKPKDGLCVGMFPKGDADQVAENATLIAGLSGRRRAGETRSA